MGLHDRPYWREPAGGWHGGGVGRGIGIGLPKPGKVVKWLLILNGGAFVLQLVFFSVTKKPLGLYLGATVEGFWQLWRYVTFQFLHSTQRFWHILLNMLALYFLGTPLERHWGPRRFLKFYLSCGVAAGVLYVIASALLLPPAAWKFPLIGASGGVYGIILAAAVLFPHFMIIFLFFPVPIRLAAAILFGIMILTLLTSLSHGVYRPEFWSSVAHFGGAACAGVWIWAIPRARRAAVDARRRRSQGAWRRKMRQRREEEAEIDRILQKIKDEGINSLTRGERKTLQDATRRQRSDEKDLLRK